MGMNSAKGLVCRPSVSELAPVAYIGTFSDLAYIGVNRVVKNTPLS